MGEKKIAATAAGAAAKEGRVPEYSLTNPKDVVEVGKSEIAGAGGTARPGYTFAKPKNPPADVGANTTARLKATSDFLTKSTSPEQYEIIKKTGFYDPLTGRKASSRDGKNIEELTTKGFVPIADKDAPTYRQMHSTLDNLKDYEAAIPQIFVDTKGMSPQAAQDAIRRNAQQKQGFTFTAPKWVPGLGGRTYQVGGIKGLSPELADIQSSVYNVLIPSLYEMQHRYGSMSEINFGAQTALPDINTDSAEVAQHKIARLAGRLKGSIEQGMSANAAAEGDASVINSVNDAFAPEPDSGGEAPVIPGEPEPVESHPPEDE
jgi:hypothetical protein